LQQRILIVAETPLTNARFGYFSDVHRDLPMSYYLDVRLEFD
jgi:hypothetical protein